MPNQIPPPPQPSGGTRRAAIPPPTVGVRTPAVHPGGLAAGTPQLAKDTAQPQVATRAASALTFSDLPVGFEPRDGDVLVVHYGAVKVPLPSGKFGSIEVGGESYTRQLRAGDDVGEQYERVYGFLKGRAERAAQEKVKGWYSQFSKSEGGAT